MKRVIRECSDSIESARFALTRNIYDMFNTAAIDLQKGMDSLPEDTLSQYFDVDTLEAALTTLSRGMGKLKQKYDRW